MKWITNGVTFARGDHYGIIARFDGAGKWFMLAAGATKQTQKSEIKRFADYLERVFGRKIESCEILEMGDALDEGKVTEEEIFGFRFRLGCEEGEICTIIPFEDF